MPQTESRQSNGGFRAEELSRREFQRTIQQAIDRHAAEIYRTQQSLKVHAEFVADVSTRVDEHTADLADLREKAEVLRIWRNRGVIGRLRWLVRGL